MSRGVAREATRSTQQASQPEGARGASWQALPEGVRQYYGLSSPAAAVQRKAEGAGAPLAEEVRAPMERSFGADFSSVRVHQDASAAAMGAVAFAHGSDLHFAAGAYQPGTQSGRELLGHELAHVQQQRQGRVSSPQGKGAPINAEPALEAEADRLGAQAARGERVEGAAGGTSIGEPAIQGVWAAAPPNSEEKLLNSLLQKLTLKQLFVDTDTKQLYDPDERALYDWSGDVEKKPAYLTLEDHIGLLKTIG